MTLNSQVREPRWGDSQMLSYVYSNYAFGNWEKNQSIHSGNHWAQNEMDLLSYRLLFWLVDHRDLLGFLELESVSSSSPKVILFFFQLHCYLRKSHRSIWEGKKERWTIYIVGSVLGSFLRGIWAYTLVWELIEGVVTLIFMIQARLLFTWLKTLLLT